VTAVGKPPADVIPSGCTDPAANRMSDTPTYASLLARLFSGSPEDREAVMAHLGRHPAQAHAVEPEVRDRLRAEHPRTRTVAAEAVLRVYGDRAAAIDALAGVLKQGDPAASTDTVGVLRQLDTAAVPLVVLMARHSPDAFNAQPCEFHRWAAAAGIEMYDPAARSFFAASLSISTVGSACSTRISTAPLGSTRRYPDDTA